MQGSGARAVPIDGSRARRNKGLPNRSPEPDLISAAPLTNRVPLGLGRPPLASPSRGGDAPSGRERLRAPRREVRTKRGGGGRSPSRDLRRSASRDVSPRADGVLGAEQRDGARRPRPRPCGSRAPLVPLGAGVRATIRSLGRQHLGVG